MRSVFKEKWFGHLALLLAALSILGGCANLNTIDRITPFNSLDDKKGKAIHLDIQQRLLVMNAKGNYCAEPSPDALAAFAAAAGIGASAPAQGAVSAAGSISSSAASIGLRTQSITLMRDALYRMCEAYGNDKLSDPQVMVLLSRSQDLTAVILATEQLTGAVVAQQAALSGTATADATAVMTATSQLLEAAIKQQERSQTRLEQAMEKKADAETKRTQAAEEFAAAQTDSSNNTGDDAAGKRARTRLTKAKSDLDAATRKVTLAEKIRALREQTLASATERVESLQAAQDSAAITAAASSSSNAALSGGGVQSRLNDQSTQAIASAVSDMVNTVLVKPYAVDYCMAIISANDEDEESAIKYIKADRDMCREIVLASIELEQTRVKGVIDSFDVGGVKNSNCIISWLDEDEANLGKLDSWREKEAGGMNHVSFMFGKESADLRSAAMKDLSIPCN